jgi:hypothetical protein
VFLVENSKVMGSAVGVSPETGPNLDYGINEDVQDSEQGLRCKEFLDRAATSQEKGKALLSAMELIEDFAADNIVEGLSVEAYMSFAKEVNRDIMRLWDLVTVRAGKIRGQCWMMCRSMREMKLC